MVYAHMRYSDKPFMGSVTAPERAEDTVAMAKILFGDDFIDPATGHEKTVVINLINANSPGGGAASLVLDKAPTQ